MSMNVFAPAFMLASGTPLILPEQSSTRAMSVGLETMSGAAVSASDLYRSIAGDAVHIDYLIGICNTHLYYPLLRQRLITVYAPVTAGDTVNFS